MNWANSIAYFFGGIFLANTIPHFVSGMMGHFKALSQSRLVKVFRHLPLMSFGAFLTLWWRIFLFATLGLSTYIRHRMFLLWGWALF